MGLVQKAFSDIITFSRSSNATRVGPTGLVEYAPHNLLLQSQTFDNASWTKNAATVTADAIAAPDGTVTADKLVESATTAIHYINVLGTLTGSTTYSVSVYAKASERSRIQLAGAAGAWGTSATATFDLSTGTVVASSVWSSASITNVGNGWYRCVATGTTTAVPSSAQYVQIVLIASGTTQSYAGDGTSGLFIWGAQFAVGPLALDYTPTTTAAVYGPRFDYDPVTLAARGLLIEEQRTNLLTYSEQFDNAAWTKTNATVTANSVASPDGTVTADSLIPTAASTSGRVIQSVTGSAGATYTLSVYGKAGAFSAIRAYSDDSGSNTASVRYNLSTGAVVSAATVSGTWTAPSSTITSIGNGWYRVTLTWTATSAAPTRYMVWCETAGDGTSGIYIWGAQVEAGAFATSYIPTVAASVTRSADVASVDTLSPWFNATEGTLFAEAAGITTDGIVAKIDDNTTSNNRIQLRFLSSSQALITSSSVNQCDLDGGTVFENTNAKFAFGFKANDFALSLNGAAVVTDASGIMPVDLIQMRIGNRANDVFMNGHIRRIAYYPRRLTNAELQSLTA